jgi:hypothetical protein
VTVSVLRCLLIRRNEDGDRKCLRNFASVYKVTRRRILRRRYVILECVLFVCAVAAGNTLSAEVRDRELARDISLYIF